MEIRWLQACSLKFLVVLGLMTAAGCASTNGHGTVEPARRDKHFFFDIQAVRDPQGNVVRIDVDPTILDSPQRGVYKGGNAYIDLPKSNRHSINWQAREPFEMKFETLVSDEGNGDDKVGDPDEPVDWSPAKGPSPTGIYTFPLPLKIKSSKGVEVITAKYFIRMVAYPKFELDPIIIVRR